MTSTGMGSRTGTPLASAAEALPLQPAPPVKQPFVRPGAAGSRTWSKGRDAFRPDPSATHRSAAQGKGGALSAGTGATRSRLLAASMARTHPLSGVSTGALWTLLAAG